MPIKVVRREGSQAWWLSGSVQGRRIRESAGTGDLALARERAAVLEAEIYRAQLHGEPDRPRHWFWHEAVADYMRAADRTADTKRRIKRLLVHFLSDARCTDVDQHALEDAADKLLRPGHKPATRLREIIAPARAVLQHAAARGGCPQPSLNVTVRDNARTEWITPVQAIRFERAAPAWLRSLIVFLLGTGARLDDAIRLDWHDANLADGRALLRKTKNGKDRWVELCPRVVAALAGIAGRVGRVFRDAEGNPFRSTRDKSGGGQVRSPWNGAAERAGLPGERRILNRSDRPGTAKRFMAVHTPHTMRHSWATWHYAEHRDLLRLKSEGGWSTVTLVERYAHLAPSSMAAAVTAWRSGPVIVAPVAQPGTKLAQSA